MSYQLDNDYYLLNDGQPSTNRTRTYITIEIREEGILEVMLDITYLGEIVGLIVTILYIMTVYDWQITAGSR